MQKRLAELKVQIPDSHRELLKYVEHTIQSLDKLEEEHRLLVASNALAGIKPNKEEEQEFYHEIQTFKELLIGTLEQTVNDLLHHGDKHWHPAFKDGVE